MKSIILVEKNKMMGKDYTIGNMSNPLVNQNDFETNLGLNSVQTQTFLEKSKLLMQFENFDDINDEILRVGKMALAQYRSLEKYNISQQTANKEKPFSKA